MGSAGKSFTQSPWHPALLCGPGTFLPSSRGRAARGLPTRCWWPLQPSSGKASRGGSRAGGREVAPKPVSLSAPQRPRLLAPTHPEASGPPGPHPGGTCPGDISQDGSSPPVFHRAGPSPLVFPGVPRTLAGHPRFMSAQVQPIPLARSRCGSWWPRTSARPLGPRGGTSAPLEDCYSAGYWEDQAAAPRGQLPVGAKHEARPPQGCEESMGPHERSLWAGSRARSLTRTSLKPQQPLLTYMCVIMTPTWRTDSKSGTGSVQQQ